MYVRQLTVCPTLIFSIKKKCQECFVQKSTQNYSRPMLMETRCFKVLFPKLLLYSALKSERVLTNYLFSLLRARLNLLCPWGQVTVCPTLMPALKKKPAMFRGKVEPKLFHAQMLLTCCPVFTASTLGIGLLLSLIHI